MPICRMWLASPRMLHRRMRADRQPIGLECRRAAEHAEALAEQVQSEAGARAVAGGDAAQHAALVHLVCPRPGAGRGRSARCADPGLPAARSARACGRARPPVPQEVRHQVGAVQAHDPQRLEVQRLLRRDCVRGRPVGTVAARTRPASARAARHLIGDQRVQLFQHAPYPPRQLLPLRASGLTTVEPRVRT